VLADDALVELVLHAHELLGLGLGELEDGDAGPHRDDVGDLLLRRCSGARRTSPASHCSSSSRFLFVRLPLLVAQVGRLLELLGLDRASFWRRVDSISSSRSR
jgi:hypothetical protein